jgi:hypothetical protein
MGHDKSVVCATGTGINIYNDNKWIYGCKYIHKDEPDVPTVQEYDDIEFTPKQYEQFMLILKGLGHLPKHIINKLSRKEKERITDTQKRAFELLNQWKFEIWETRVDNFLIKVFPNVPLVKNCIARKKYNSLSIKVELSFKDLNISNQMIVDKLLEWDILPKNFYKLK